MHNKLTILAVTLLLVGFGHKAYAQFSTENYVPVPNSQLWTPNMDMDIYRIKANAFPDVRFHADDYIQYSPAAIMLLTKACGYEGRSSWGRMLAADAFSIAFMAIAVNGIKYGAQRMRPNMSDRHSFPSGHTATAFTLATMLHMEYGWRSKWFSIGGYAIAASTALMRMANNCHWMSDTIAGALIGIGMVHLGYFVNDKIFKDKYRNPNYSRPEFFYDRNERIYDFDLLFSRRFILGGKNAKATGSLPDRGSNVSINASIPTGHPRAGIMARIGAGSMENVNIYNFMAGGYWNCPFAKRFQTEVHLMTGYANLTTDDTHRMNVLAGTSLALCVAPNFKIKAFAEYENTLSFRHSDNLNSIMLGFSGGFYF